MMHFSGRTWRPHYEADSCIIELTAGCTYGKCNFCNLYENEPFRMVSLEQFEEDLQEIKVRIRRYGSFGNCGQWG